jgi:hypothetical protein
MGTRVTRGAVVLGSILALAAAAAPAAIAAPTVSTTVNCKPNPPYDPNSSLVVSASGWPSGSHLSVTGVGYVPTEQDFGLSTSVYIGFSGAVDHDQDVKVTGPGVPTFTKHVYVPACASGSPAPAAKGAQSEPAVAQRPAGQGVWNEARAPRVAPRAAKSCG